MLKGSRQNRKINPQWKHSRRRRRRKDTQAAETTTEWHLHGASIALRGDRTGSVPWNLSGASGEIIERPLHRRAHHFKNVHVNGNGPVRRQESEQEERNMTTITNEASTKAWKSMTAVHTHTQTHNINNSNIGLQKIALWKCELVNLHISMCDCECIIASLWILAFAWNINAFALAIVKCNQESKKMAYFILLPGKFIFEHKLTSQIIKRSHFSGTVQTSNSINNVL